MPRAVAEPKVASHSRLTDDTATPKANHPYDLVAEWEEPVAAQEPDLIALWEQIADGLCSGVKCERDIASKAAFWILQKYNVTPKKGN